MNNIYYNLAHLKSGKDISFKKDKIIVNLSFISDEIIIQNDEQFNEVLNSKNYFYISGGGSFIFNKRYLILVMRDKKTLVNSNKLSLFTGRSNSYAEWKNPTLIMRELFEEVSIYKDNSLLSYKNKKYQSIINQISNKESIPSSNFLDIEEFKISNFRLVICNNDRIIWNKKVFMHISNKNDLNLLYFFNINLNPEKLKFASYEDSLDNKRQVFFYDLLKKEILFLNKNNSLVPEIKSHNLTEHCQFAIDHLSKNIIKEK